jgi:uncharacterized membrane protein
MIESLSNPAHVHLLLNHVPTVGFGLAIVLFFVAHARRNDDLKRTGLVLFFAVAVVAIASYLSGNAAESLVEKRTDISRSAVRAHEDAALLAFAFMEVTGFFAWLALWQWRRVPALAGWQLPTVFVLSIVTFGLMAQAATLGGEIHHPEIRAVESVAAVETAAAGESAAASIGRARSIGMWVNSEPWVWPTSETVHFIGLSLLFTVVLIVDLRLLGMMKSVPYSAVYQLLPIGMLGFGLNLVTGLLFYMGALQHYVHNKTFYWKIVFVVLGGLNLLYFMLQDDVWAVGAGDDAPLSSKIAAASAIFLWVAVLFCGHMLPFLGNAF